MLKKHHAIISLVEKNSARHLKCMHKFGIECPKTVEDALELYKHNGNTMWSKWDPVVDGIQPPNGYQFIRCHMIFNVNLEYFCQKV